MKKIVVLVIVGALAVSAWGQESSSQQFLREQLIIDKKSGVGGFFSSNGAGTIYSYSSWSYFRGLYPISEARFLAIAGFPNESQESLAIETGHKKTMKGLEITGIVSSVLLIGGLVGGYVASEVAHLPENSPASIASLAALYLGGAGYCITFPLYLYKFRNPPRLLSLGQAEAIASAYNSNLRAKLGL